jgi:nitroreductase
MSDAIEHIFRRRSIRAYQNRPIDRKTITQLLKAAMAAPTAANSRPWEFVVVTDAETLQRLRESHRRADYNAPTAIVVCGNPALAENAAAKRFWVQDCSAATENILLAAVALGLGSVWIGLHPLNSLQRRVAKIVGLPEGVLPLSMVYVGYPAEEKPPRTQYDPTRVHYDRYGDSR